MASENTVIKKPPLGVSPAYITIEARIKELGEAISRYDSLTQTTDQIKSWAKEILIYCDTSDAIKNIQKERTEEYFKIPHNVTAWMLKPPAPYCLEGDNKCEEN